MESKRAHLDTGFRSERSAVLARRGMVCASVPIAADAGVAMLQRGGNAVDAAIAAAAVLCVVEPMSTGIGGDAFALLWSAEEERLVGLNGSGRAPATASSDAYRARGLHAVPPNGILSATVPGAVHAWQALSDRYGTLPLGDLLDPAIRTAEEGFPVTELVSHYWTLLAAAPLLDADARRSWLPDGRAPSPAEWIRVPDLGRSLRAIAKSGAAAFYSGEIADAIVATSRRHSGLFSHDDLAGHQSSWVEPITTDYRGTTVAELPPNGQGLTALIGLNILEQLPAPEPGLESADDWHHRIEAIKLAFADRGAYIGDPGHVEVPVEALLSKDYAARRAARVGARAISRAAPGLAGDTVYLCAADDRGNLVSFIQSLYTGFGSGVGCGDTGIVLQSRGAGFVLDAGHPNEIAPGKRPLHTIIPGMLLSGERPRMAFGLMGGPVQPQSHLNFVANLVDHGMNPQEALDRHRFHFVGGNEVALEAPDVAVAEGGTLEAALRARGHDVIRPAPRMIDFFGGGQAIAREPNNVLVGASDRRKDGCARGRT